MMYMKIILSTVFFTYSCASYFGETENAYKWPTVGVSVLVRNKAHTLPYFLTCLYNLDYPKERLYLWIYSDFNEDNSIEILEKWVEKYGSEYNGILLTTNNTSGPLHPDEKTSTSWTSRHFRHVITLREKALKFSRRLWADYLFMIDADVFLTNRETLKVLVKKDYMVVAPMLISDGLYSNFWCGMTESYYYKRTDDYKPILKRENVGCFKVPMVHTAVLVSLRRKITDRLTYDPLNVHGYKGPQDDIIVFAVNAKNNGIPLYVCNEELFGFVPVPLEDGADLANDQEQLINLKLEAIGRHDPIPVLPDLEISVEYPESWTFGFSAIYMINLERREERMQLMQLSFKELGMKVKLYNAVDGKNLDMDNLQDHSITLMPGYEDPYHKRPMKAGEVGCFLSHYNIWKEAAERGYKNTLVLEDDIHFTPFFRHQLLNLLAEIEHLEWDLVYIGRKILLDGSEEYVTEHTTRPLYSYWTLGYFVSSRGVKKLLDAKPLDHLLPVDEFLPIMFNQHPNDTWKSYFPVRDLVALSAAPLLVHPTHYTGEPGYVSDTEDSPVLPRSAPSGSAARNEL